MKGIRECVNFMLDNPAKQICKNKKVFAWYKSGHFYCKYIGDMSSRFIDNFSMFESEWEVFYWNYSDWMKHQGYVKQIEELFKKFTLED